MASIYKRKDGRWVAQYTDVTGKQKYLYAGKRKDVKVKLDKVLEDQKQALKQGADKLNLSEYLEDWLGATTGTVAESSHDLRKLYARKHIAPALGHVKLSDLDALDRPDLLPGEARRRDAAPDRQAYARHAV